LKANLEKKPVEKVPCELGQERGMVASLERLTLCRAVLLQCQALKLPGEPAQGRKANNSILSIKQHLSNMQ